MKIKILIINPNSDISMTASIKELVRRFNPEHLDISVVGMSASPKFIESAETINASYEEVLKTIRENEKEYEIFILACHLDPNLEKLREETSRIVIGIGEASVLYSQVLGKRYSIIGSSNKTVELKNDMVNRYGAEKGLDYIGYPDGVYTSLIVADGYAKYKKYKASM